MASIFFKRLKDKYNTEDITGKKYQKVISEVLSYNNEKIAKATLRISNENYKNSAKKLSQEKFKTVKLPDVSDVFPKRSVFIIKAAQDGKIISLSLKEQLERDLRAAMKEFDGTGENKMEIQRGISTGKINPKLIESFQNKISQTFESRTKRDKETGVPPQVRNIAVTEIRSTIGSIKESYNRELLSFNPQLQMAKTWKHNRKLSKKPRLSHVAMDGVTIPISEMFKVDREHDSGYDIMTRPHDPNAPAEQVIGCSCDCIYKARFKS